MDSYKPTSVVTKIRQSPPLDFSKPYDASWVKDKVILITGGASGFGAGFVRKWAKNGATIIVGDINVKNGLATCREINKDVGGERVHFVHCDVTDWQSQVDLFKEAVKLSPHGGLDCVVANAGIAGNDPFLAPQNFSVPSPPPPNMKIMAVNITGVMYTTHLAQYWLPRNPGSVDCSTTSSPTSPRDRHLLLLGSMASIGPIAVQPQYCASKHAVLGLFRSLRALTGLSGIRINMLLPYFIETPIVQPVARLALAGGAMGEVEDVVDAGTRFVCDSRILGRSAVIGPKMHVRQKSDGEFEIVTDGSGGDVKALWEACVDDWEDVESFNEFFIKALNRVQIARGWAGWAGDVVKTVMYAIGLKR